MSTPSLTTIIKRLEAATSRLEDIAETQAINLRGAQTLQHPQSQSSVGVPPPAISEDPPALKGYDETVVLALQSFVALSDALHPVLKEQAFHVATLFSHQRDLIVRATACMKPSDAAFQILLTPFITEMTKIGEIKDQNRAGPNKEYYNHLSAVADGVPALGWVMQAPKPAPFIAEMKNAAQFYSNRVVKEFKEKDKRHTEWTRKFDGLLEALRKYVLEHHTTGLTWNSQGQDSSKYAPAITLSPSATTAPTSFPPPPPPPPPPIQAAAPIPSNPAPVSSGGGAAAVFAELNKGEAVTAGLRKVAASEMTHKNPSLRSSSIVPVSPPSAASPTGKKPVRPAKPAALLGKKPSKMALEGNKWVVASSSRKSIFTLTDKSISANLQEFFDGDKSLVINECAINQTVNLYGCKNTTLQITGKVNAVTLVNCVKTSVLVSSVISAISVTSSPSFALQVTQKAPTITLDACDGGQIYLSQPCLDAGVEITSAKCSSINVSVPDGKDAEEGVFVERAMPEMIRTVISGGKLISNIVEVSG